MRWYDVWVYPLYPLYPVPSLTIRLPDDHRWNWTEQSTVGIELGLNSQYMQYINKVITNTNIIEDNSKILKINISFIFYFVYSNS